MSDFCASTFAFRLENVQISSNFYVRIFGQNREIRPVKNEDFHSGKFAVPVSAVFVKPWRPTVCGLAKAGNKNSDLQFIPDFQRIPDVE
jgi:hypothetical protein